MLDPSAWFRALAIPRSLPLHDNALKPLIIQSRNQSTYPNVRRKQFGKPNVLWKRSGNCVEHLAASFKRKLHQVPAAVVQNVEDVDDDLGIVLPALLQQLKR